HVGVHEENDRQQDSNDTPSSQQQRLEREGNDRNAEQRNAVARVTPTAAARCSAKGDNRENRHDCHSRVASAYCGRQKPAEEYRWDEISRRLPAPTGWRWARPDRVDRP